MTDDTGGEAVEFCSMLTLDPLGQELTLPCKEGEAIVSVDLSTADFATDLGNGNLYIEQNDDGGRRTATVAVILSDGSTRAYQLQQAPASRASSSDVRRSFYKHYGVGYSYDAVAGKYCDLNYVRCQVLNRAVIDQVQEKELLRLISVDYQNKVRYNHSLSTSIVDYVHNTNFYATGKGNILCFSGSVTSSASAFEEGLIETYILHNDEVHPRAAYRLDAGSVAYLLEKHHNLLTSSFRKAVEKIAATDVDNWTAVDEFIELYGTHVVNTCELGARIDLDVQVETHKFIEQEFEKFIADIDLAKMFKKKWETSIEEKNYQLLRDCRCKLEVTGGDVSLLDEIVGLTTFNFEDVEVSPETLAKWRESIYFNDNDLANSNVELTEMSVTPIWEFITDPQVAQRVEARIMSDAAIMQNLMGNRNFLNVSFDYPVESVTCRIGSQTGQTFPHPAVTDIITAGRHVATVCEEWVPEISSTEKVQVAYPIYEGHVKITNGLCVHNGKVFLVDWRNGAFQVTQLGEATNTESRKMYINLGALSITPTEVKGGYQEGHPILGCERPGGISITGQLSGEMVPVCKHFGHFYLVDDHANHADLPSWHFASELPKEAEKYADYFSTESWKDRMVRNDDYIYLFNTTEIGYE